jgi:transcriptional regulator with XRE-family HTH domain
MLLSGAVTVLETGDETMRAKTAKGFGARLAQVRQQRGLSQEALAAAVGVSRRVIAYYEAESDQPPGALLAVLARTLKVSADELLGLKPVKDKTSPRSAGSSSAFSRWKHYRPRTSGRC